MSETINGSGLATFNRETFTFTPNVGGEWGGRYEGPKAAVIAAMYNLANAGYSVQYECDASPIASFTYSVPTTNSGAVPSSANDDYTDNYQVSRNTAQKEILMSDHPLVTELNATNLEELKAYMLAPSIFVEAEGFTLTGAASFDAANYLWDLFQSGVKCVEVKQPILRITRQTNPLYDRPFDVTLMDRVLTTSRMISDSGVPSNFAIPLVALATQMERGTVTRADALELNFGWLKDTVTLETIGTRRIQYVVEYKFGLWDQQLYGTVVT